MESRKTFIIYGLGILAVIVIIFVLIFLGKQGSDLPEVSEVPLDPQSIAYENLKSASNTQPEVYIENFIPRGLLVDVKVSGKTPVDRAQEFLETYSDLYLQNDPDLSLNIRRTNTESMDHVTLYQTYQGIPIYGAEIVVSLNGDYVRSIVGGLLPSGLELDTTPGITNNHAEDIARNDLEIPDATIFGQTRLMVFDKSLLESADTDPHLVWRVAVGNMDSWTSFVDAQSGEVIYKYESTQTGQGGFDLDLEDANGTNAKSTDCYWNTTANDELGTETGLHPEGQNDPEAVALWNYAKATYNFYHSLNIHSYDNNDGQYELYVHADVDNAQWVAANNDCDLIEFRTGWVGYDILVHEVAHAVITFSSGLYYHGESGALNESYADVMGALADGNWTVGEGRTGGGAIRSFANPTIYGQPDYMSDYVWTSADHGGVHTNSGIPNKAAYILAVGQSGNSNQVSVNGIGLSSMGRLYFQTMRNLPSSAKFIDARNLTVSLASSNYPNHPSFACEVRNAFFLVGIGEADIDCDGIEDGGDSDRDGVPWDLDNCHGIFNPKQIDVDSDGYGRACDPDDNGNGQLDYLDTVVSNPYLKCPTPFEPCDTNNYDGDNFPNDEDNCPYIINNGQKDTDQDGVGDACDADTDLDGWSNDNDNCPWTPNEDQANADGDFAGDACDKYPNCPDVYAWTTGTLIGGVEIPPMPIQQPLNCNYLAKIKEDSPVDAIDPNGSPSLLDLTRGETPNTLLPLPPCPPDLARYSPEYRGTLNLIGVDPRIRVWVADDRGQAVSSKKREPGVWELQFRPQGGRSYFLTFADFRDEGEVNTFELSMLCGLIENMSHSPAERTPGVETPQVLTPSPTSTRIPANTPIPPTPTPTIRTGNTPGPTPTPGRFVTSTPGRN